MNVSDELINLVRMTDIELFDLYVVCVKDDWF